jgi:transketolase
MKSFDYEGVAKMAEGMKGVVTAEEHSYLGGLASATALALRTSVTPMDYVAINDIFGESAHYPEELQTAFGLTADDIAEKARKLTTGKS